MKHKDQSVNDLVLNISDCVLSPESQDLTTIVIPGENKEDASIFGAIIGASHRIVVSNRVKNFSEIIACCPVKRYFYNNRNKNISAEIKDKKLMMISEDFDSFHYSNTVKVVNTNDEFLLQKYIDKFFINREIECVTSYKFPSINGHSNSHTKLKIIKENNNTFQILSIHEYIPEHMIVFSNSRILLK